MTDIDTLLRAADPAAGVPDYSDAERRHILVRAIAPTTPPKRRAGLRIGAVAAAVVMVTAVGVSNLVGTGATARADQILTEAAINAVDPPATADQYWKMTGTADYGTGEVCGESFTETHYLAVDGNRPSWYVESYDTAPGCPPLGEDRIWTLTKSPNAMVDSWRWPSPAFLASLPRDPEQLRSRLYADAKGIGASSTDAGVFVLIDYALTYGAPPADLRSAMFEVLKDVPGISVADEMVVDGREVALFTLEGGEVTEMLMIDPEAGQLVGFQGVQNERKVTYERLVVDTVPEEVQDAADMLDCEVGFDDTINPAGDLICR